MPKRERTRRVTVPMPVHQLNQAQSIDRDSGINNLSATIRMLIGLGARQYETQVHTQGAHHA
jgi:hypothetical protein